MLEPPNYFLDPKRKQVTDNPAGGEGHDELEMMQEDLGRAPARALDPSKPPSVRDGFISAVLSEDCEEAASDVLYMLKRGVQALSELKLGDVDEQSVRDCKPIDTMVVVCSLNRE